MQDFKVQPLKAYILKYTGLYSILISDARRTGRPRDEREREFLKRLVKLKQEFGAERKAEFKSKSFKMSAIHTLTKGYPGGTKRRNHKKHYTPISLMRTSQALTSKTGKGDVRIGADGQWARLYQQRSGKGKSKGRIHIEFRYRDDLIEPVIQSEIIHLFSQIAENYGVEDFDFDKDDESTFEIAGDSFIEESEKEDIDFEELVLDSFT